MRCAQGETGRRPCAARVTLLDVDIRIGIANTPREISFESSQSAAEVEQIVAAALEAGSTFVKLTDDKGKIYVVPLATFAYIEIGSDQSRRVGFVA